MPSARSEPALVEGPADDRAGSSRRPGALAQVVERGDPAGRDDVAAPEPDEPLVEAEVRAAEEAVAVDRGHLERRDAGVGQRGDRLGRRRRRRRRAPSRGRRRGRRARRSRRRSGRRRASPTSRPTSAGSRRAAVPTTTRAAPDARTARRRPRRSAARRRPRRAARSPTAATIARIDVAAGPAVPIRAPSRSTTWSQRAPASANPRATAAGSSAVRRLPGEVALPQADHATAAQVDRRQDLEAACRPSWHHASVLARYYATHDAARSGDGDMADDWRTPDVEALFEAILRLDDARRDRALLPRPLHAHRAPRHGPALGRRPAARRRPALRRDLPADRREHRDDHPDRVVAQPRRGRLPGDARQARRRIARRHDAPTPSRASDEAPPPPRDPEQGSPRRADAPPAPRRRPGLRGARPEPRRRASRTTTSTSCSSAPTTSSSSSATASPTSASPASTC